MKVQKQPVFASIDDYLASQDDEIRRRLIQISEIVRKVRPDAEGKISYNMPAYFCGGRRLIYFCAFKKHIGFYPASMRVFDVFRNELSGFKQTGRGTVQFPHDKDLPTSLIEKIVRFRVKENESQQD